MTAPNPNKNSRQILVTTALPYANGPIHLGHLLEHVQADIWVRFQRLIGNTCYFFCADDTHGTPILVRAKNEGRTPEALIADVFRNHTATFKTFGISFDHYSSTNSETNRQVSEEFYHAMVEHKHIEVKKIEQTYCPNDKMFLPDRFVKGTCPKCGSPNQYGDSCDNCGSTYSPTDLKGAVCTLCGTTPTLEKSDHVFFKLNDFKTFLKDWVPRHTSNEVTKKLNEWLQDDLRNWDISRDEPYFGFKIPGYTDKYFYVWVDAPIGYIAASKDYFAQHRIDFLDFWKSEQSELHHFIGKDIVYFHALFWPAMLKTAGYRTPTQINVHGFLTVNGEKMSKSKGTFINADTYAKHLDTSYLRYYLASKLTDGLDDLDLNLEDFTLRVNSDLVGKYVNLGSRSAQMLHKNFGGKLLTPRGAGLQLCQDTAAISETLRKHFEKKEFSKAINLIREAVDKANKYFDEIAPWQLIKTDTVGAHECLSATLLVFRTLSIYLTPVIPVITEKVQALFGEKDWSWTPSALYTGAGSFPQQLSPFTHLIQRVDTEKVKAMIEDSKASMGPAPTAGTPAAAPLTPAQDAFITIDDFNKIDLRVAQVLAAEDVAGTDKMLKLRVSLDGQEKTIFAGIKKAYSPEKLVGRQVLVVANLQPRKMKFGTSEGMVLCASNGDQLFVLSPDAGAAVGSKVK